MLDPELSPALSALTPAREMKGSGMKDLLFWSQLCWDALPGGCVLDTPALLAAPRPLRGTARTWARPGRCERGRARAGGEAN